MYVRCKLHLVEDITDTEGRAPRLDERREAHALQ